MPGLFDEFTLRGVTLRNRVGISPMCMYWSDDGRASDWHLVHLGSRAVGGAGLVIAEATAVTPEGRISPRDAGLWSNDQVGPLARINAFIAEYGSVPGIQLAHAGRKGSTAAPYLGQMDRSLADDEGGFATVAPSAIPFRDGGRVPRELTVGEIHALQDAFVAATRRAVDAGYKWLELHGAHGYLMNEFHSPLSNNRADEYGGSFANRTRFTVETVRKVRAAWPDHLPLTIRLSVTDWAEGGWTTEESVELSRTLKAEGVDLVDCSSGFVVPGVKYPMAPGWQVPLAEAVRRGADMPTAAVGMITGPAQADAIIREGRADLVLLGRESLRDPYWPFHAARALGQAERAKLPTPYDYAVH